MFLLVIRIYEGLFGSIMALSEVFEDVLVLLGLFVALAFVVGSDLGGEFLVEALQPFVAFDLGLEWRCDLHRDGFTSFRSSFSRLMSLNQGCPRIS